MRLAPFVLELLGACSAGKSDVFERLNDESVQLSIHVNGLVALWTSRMLLFPVFDAGSACELIASTTLLGVLHDFQADRAGEVAIHATNGLLDSQLGLGHLVFLLHLDLILEISQQGVLGSEHLLL